MQNSFGLCYTEAKKAILEERNKYSIKKGRHGWLVFSVQSGRIVYSMPTRLRAYYTATKLNGVNVENYFYFGDLLG